jgi:hypothetical protein
MEKLLELYNKGVIVKLELFCRIQEQQLSEFLPIELKTDYHLWETTHPANGNYVTFCIVA